MQKSLKKVNGLFLLAAFTGILLLPGCQFFESKSKDLNIDDHPLERRIGTIMSLGGIKTTNNGTHILSLDNGDTILLRSLQINFDDPDYAGKVVEVRGIINYSTDNKQIMDVMNMDIIDDIPTQQTALLQWKDYSNTQPGFSLKYRDDFKVNDSAANTVSFEKILLPSDLMTIDQSGESTQASQILSVTHKFSLSRTFLAEGQTLYSLLGLKDNSASSLLAKNLSNSKIGAESMDALKQTFDGKSLVKYFLQNQKSIYEITIDSGSDLKSVEDQNVFYQMLGTFKPGQNLTDQENSSLQTDVQPVSLPQTQQDDLAAAIPTQQTQQIPEGFETLKNDSYKFSIQYPKRWYFQGSAGTESGVLRHYEFGGKPLDQEAGTIFLDLISGSAPPGTDMTVNGVEVVEKNNGSTVEYYIKGKRVYRLSGPGSEQSTLLKMVGTLTE